VLGEALLKRIYSRIEHTENLFRVEIGQVSENNKLQNSFITKQSHYNSLVFIQVYDKLKQDIQKNFRKCDRKRRKADHLKDKNNFHSNKEGSEKQKQKRDKKKSNKRKDKKSDREREAGAKRPYESWADRDDFPSQLYQSQYR
jgi:hypothetical protein